MPIRRARARDRRRRVTRARAGCAPPAPALSLPPGGSFPRPATGRQSPGPCCPRRAPDARTGDCRRAGSSPAFPTASRNPAAPRPDRRSLPTRVLAPTTGNGESMPALWASALASSAASGWLFRASSITSVPCTRAAWDSRVALPAPERSPASIRRGNSGPGPARTLNSGSSGNRVVSALRLSRACSNCWWALNNSAAMKCFSRSVTRHQRVRPVE